MHDADFNDIVTRYLSAWNERDPARRRGLIEQTFATQARYADPLIACQGHDELNAAIAAVQARFAGHLFTGRGQREGHGRWLRFSWSLRRLGEAPIAAGTDFAELDSEGRLSSVTGFLDAVARPARSVGAFATAADGETLFCRDVGAGAPVVLVHGWGLSSQMWQHQTGPLVGAGLRCITYDRRGHGRSSPAAAGYDYDTLADDLEAVLAHHDLQGVTLVGHSMGCAEIVRYFARHGSRRVARVLLIAPLTPVVLRTPDNPDGVPLEMFEQQWASWRTDFAAWVEANRQPFFTSDTSPAMMSWAAGLLLATHLDVALATSRASVTADLRPDLATIDRPVLVIHGSRDASVPLALGRRTAAAVEGARVSVYEGAPHGLFLTHAARLNEELIAFARS